MHIQEQMQQFKILDAAMRRKFRTNDNNQIGRRRRREVHLKQQRREQSGDGGVTGVGAGPGEWAERSGRRRGWMWGIRDSGYSRPVSSSAFRGPMEHICIFWAGLHIVQGVPFSYLDRLCQKKKNYLDRLCQKKKSYLDMSP